MVRYVDFSDSLKKSYSEISESLKKSNKSALSAVLKRVKFHGKNQRKTLVFEHS